MMDPLLARIAAEAAPVLLAVHDWSILAFGGHESKADRRQLTHDADVGYDLATVLVLHGGTGDPIAPASVTMLTKTGTIGTRDDPPTGRQRVPHVDQVLPAMGFVAAQRWTPPVVHVIDREADSVGHWRQWAKAGHLALVRADDRLVLHDGAETTLVRIADEMVRRGQLQESAAVRYHGRPARQFVAETAVTLHRPAKRRIGKRQVEIPGAPLELRLVVAEVRNAEGRTLARWLLLSNVPATQADATQADAAQADAATLARWYYHRWQIETLHKTLKSAGFELEGWTQRTADRVLRKLLLALGALAEVWALERAHDEDSAAFRLYLMALSGRSTKRHRRVTTTGLLAGALTLQALEMVEVRAGPAGGNALLARHLPLRAALRQPS